MRRDFTLLFLILSSFITHSQTFYNSNAIQDIRIVFSQSNWDALLDAQEAGAGDYISAQSVTINGQVFNNVGVKYKGNSSYNPNYVKNPLHIELDTYVNQNYEGYTDIKLSNVIFDPSFVRETTAYSILGQYMHAPLANYANVYINGNLIGLYTNVESISKKFVNTHFGSNNNAFFSCSPPAGAGPGTTNLPNLAYLGTNSASYESAYEIKSTTGWDDLINLTNTLSNNTTNIESVLDVDRALWMLAFDNLFVNIDSYIGQFKQNYYLYKDDNGRFNPILWDLNMSFGTFGQTGTTNLNTTLAKRQLNHLLHSGDAAWPLVQKLLAVPRYKKMYLAHYATMLSENISNNSYFTKAQTFQALINSSVQADLNKFYTYAQFSSNMTTDIALGMNTAPGLSNLMSGRNTYLTALSDFTATKPTISAITPSVANPALGGTVTIRANVINTNTDAVFLGYRAATNLPFTKVLMFDDGAHNDGASGDNIYGGLMPISSITSQYYIYAENNTIGAFSPARAEHEFYTITASYPTITPGSLVVNEIMAQNTSTVTDPSGDYSDWFELYNNSSVTISLDNLFASDTSTNLLKWQFPSGITMAPNSYLIVWADQDLTQEGIHADFKFSASGESCILSYANGIIIENVTFGVQVANMGYARVPNGTGNFVIQAPTFNANNQGLSISDFNQQNNQLLIYPNPTSNYVNIRISELMGSEKIKIFNLLGQIVIEKEAHNDNTLDLTILSAGTYVVNYGKINKKIVVFK
ncbi:MAG TPA: CotH kinase family protein [Flavobacterium sp.]|nr:CotH kinase family protein [Flavobacterium sp.]